MTVMHLIISCLHYLSYTINKYETMIKQSIKSELYTLAEDLQSLYDSKTNLTNMSTEMDI